MFPNDRHEPQCLSTAHRRIARLSRIGAVALALSAAALPALAQDAKPKSLGPFNDWNAFKIDNTGGAVCYVVSEPVEKKPSNVNRDDVFFMITDWGPKREGLEPSMIIGYPFKAGSTATVTIGSDKFELFTNDDGAWLRDTTSEQKIIAAMRRGASMTVTGTSQRGTLTTDRYSLKGISAALDKITEACP